MPSQGWHADISGMNADGGNGANLTDQIHDGGGKLYAAGNANLNTSGKTANSVPLIGWCFRITDDNDTADSKLVAAKRAFFDGDSSGSGAAACVLAAGDIFQIVDPGTTNGNNAVLNYIGNAVDANPDGDSGSIAFSYGIVEGSKYLYCCLTSSAVDYGVT